MTILDELETKCVSHDGGKHCWHQGGQMGFSGRFQSSCRVVCCHCEANGRQYFDVRPNGYVEMRQSKLEAKE